MNATESKASAAWRPLALLLVLAASLLVIAFRLMPYGIRGVNFVPAGAMLLFAGARLRPRFLLPLALISLLATDLYFYQVKDWPFPFFNYIGYVLYAALGWGLLARTRNPFGIAGTALVGGTMFFLVTNFGVWIEHVVQPEMFAHQPYQYPPTFAGLMLCFEMALPFFQGTFASDLLFTGLLFGAYAVLAKAYFPAEYSAASEVRS